MQKKIADKIFYGWVIVGTMWLINFSTMATGNLNLGLFVLPMTNTLGMSRQQFGWAQTARRLTAGGFSYFAGRILDKYGPRYLIVLSTITIAICLFLCSLTAQPWHFIMLFGIMGISGLGAPNSIVTSVPVAKWFEKNRGKALALATSGLGMGGMFFLPFTQMLIENVGWENTWAFLSIIFICLSLPCAVLFLRRQPEDMGLLMDGAKASLHDLDPQEHTKEVVWTVPQAFKTTTMWKLITIFALAAFVQGGTSVHRIPFWIEQGFDPKIVAYSFAGDAFGAATMALISGWLADRINIVHLGIVSFLGFSGSFVMMLTATTNFWLFAAGITFGLSVGASMVLHSYIFAHFYGREFLGSLRGIVTPILLTSAGIGAPLIGYIRDIDGDYSKSWTILLAICVLNTLMMFTVKQPHQQN
jgi:MFS family permease